MTYLLALIAVVAIAVLCWKAFGPDRGAGYSAPMRRAPKRVVGPDDDPEFLWRISRQQHRDSDPGPAEH
ncbi:hypothetical protein GV791_04040 [Nocardia cyriacigeorgica]|uniref:Uncharacterized protein n=2 Tax=Nocardia cyriacigeorgica TaxID=135487 RepID=H6R3B0_NOCCG|nr:hypothetical protein [Nocardia cyriacigeorgica]MBF6082175.1 hypothetical protein [Nocardia cyriacigeorgica]NEW31732.1 hypothetical protein [Nocardia cyriacigeorgica]BDT89406.1 hypothetical protein FMUAM8_51700 [Nocardia cyriacigeorgica]CCF65708.1 conserved exported protein of unknown function [Nocardia cyriacigeorgica GUH-2]